MQLKGIENLEKYVDNLVYVLMEDDNLCKLLIDTSSNPLDYNLSNKDKKKIIKENIIKHKHIPYLLEEEKIWICFFFEEIFMNQTNNAFYDTSMVVNVICHDAISDIENGDRLFKVMSRVEKLLNNSREFGIGKLTLENAQYINPAKNYTGYKMNYILTDFN